MRIMKNFKMIMTMLTTMMFYTMFTGGCEMMDVTPSYTPDYSYNEPVEVPKVEEPEEIPTVEIPTVEEPVVEEPTVEEPVVEETKEEEKSEADKLFELMNGGNKDKGKDKVTEPYYRDDAEAFVAALNKEREALGIAPLTLRTEGYLHDTAKRRVVEISTDFRHNGTATFECIHKTTKIDKTAEDILMAFKESTKGHWEILTSVEFSRVGVAIYIAEDGCLYACVLMGGN